MEKIIKFKKHVNVSGKLVPFYCNQKNKFPFLNKRVFLIYGKKNFKRSNHAHKICNQLLFCVTGKIQITVNKKKKYILTANDGKGLLIQKLHWTEINFMRKESILMVFCDQHYSSEEYIRDYNEFLTMKKAKS
jgi:dTDP-4-dehydrorhamnose 3,5-epimerase-like enzyme